MRTSLHGSIETARPETRMAANRGTVLLSTDKTVLRPQEAADLLGVSRASLYRLIATGGFPVIHIGGCARVPVQALDQWMRDRLVEEQGFLVEARI